MKHNNIFIRGIAEGEESEQGIENLSEETKPQNFPNQAKEKILQVREAHTPPNNLHPNRPTLRNIIIK